VSGLDLRLVPAALAAWATAFIVIALDVPTAAIVLGWLTAVAAMLAAVLVSRSRERTVLVHASVCLAVAALIATVSQGIGDGRSPPVLTDAAAASERVTAIASVTATGMPGDEFLHATLTRAEGAALAGVPVLVFGEVDRRIEIGEELEVDGRLVPTEPADDVAFLVFADRWEQRASPPWWLAWSADMRRGFTAAASHLPRDGGDLLPGLAIGDTGSVGADLDAAMKASSLSHLTAVSGANCAIIVGLALALARLLGMGRRTRLIAAGALLAAFVVLVTPEPSVVRAAVMAGVVLLSGFGERSSRGVPVLATAVVLILVADPWLSRDYGFALSALATGALVTIASPLADRLSRWLPSRIALVLAVPVAAQIAVQPVLILLEPSVPVYGVIANVLAEPAAPVATVVGLLACVVHVVWPVGGVAIAWVAWLPSAWIAATARFFASSPGGALPWLGGLAGVLLLAVLTIVALVAALAQSGRVRLVAASIAAVLIVGIGAATAATQIVPRLSRPGDWQIAGCDVGQGDAFLVRNGGAIALIDTGPDPELLRSCLDELGVTRIDLLVLTHFDLDHVGGLDAVIGRVAVAAVGPPGSAEDEERLATLAASGAEVVQVRRGDAGRLGGYAWSVLWPLPPPRTTEPGNDASVTIAFECSTCVSAVFLGDLGQRSQSELLASGPLPLVDVVKVAHHGSADQDPRVYERADAVVALIGVGADNDYGHPTDSLLDVLDANGMATLRTDRNGMYLLSPRGEPGGVAAWTERDGGSG
jgi:competence protein ComEC